QIQAGELPEPERIYVPLGSGGIAAGLSVGLAFAGLTTRVVAVSVVERALSPAIRFRGLQRAVVALLEARGLGPVPRPAPLIIERAELGRGYAHPTAAALAACEVMASEDITLEPVYTGKAMAGLIADAARSKAARAGRVLLWQSARRSPLP